MSLNRFTIMIFLLCIVSFAVFGAETKESTAGEKEKPSYLLANFQFTVNAGVGFSAYQWHFTGGLQADFNANPVLGIGFKSTVDYGFDYGNLNINLYILYKIWWFYIGPGVSFIVQGMTIPADDSKYVSAYPNDGVASLAFTGGARFPVARIGPGFMTMDLSIDWYQNDIPLSQITPPFTGARIKELVNGSTYAFKFAARLGYTF